jgi:hypothetical protein
MEQRAVPVSITALREQRAIQVRTDREAVAAAALLAALAVRAVRAVTGSSSTRHTEQVVVAVEQVVRRETLAVTVATRGTMVVEVVVVASAPEISTVLVETVLMDL